MVVRPMADDAKEPTFSMGDDSPLPNLSPRSRPVSHFLRQRFAQVTNPPIDPLRERLVMSLRTILGPRLPLLTESRDAARLLTLPSFFVYPSGVAGLELTDRAPWPVIPLDATFPVAEGPAGAAGGGRAPPGGGGRRGRGWGRHAGPRGRGRREERAPVPSLLACGAVHQALSDARQRSRTSLVVVADDVFDVHGFRGPAGLRRRRHLPPPGPGHGGRRGRQRRRRRPDQPRSPEKPPGSGRGRRAQDHVQDGHQHRRLLPRRPDLRGGGPGRRGGGRVLHRHSQRGRRHGLARPGRGRARPPRRRLGDRPDLASPGFFRVRKGGEPHAKDKDTCPGPQRPGAGAGASGRWADGRC